MPWPKDERLTNYTKLTPIKSADLVKMQDATINNSHGLTWRNFGSWGALPRPPNTPTQELANIYLAWDFPGPGNGSLYLELPVAEGDVVTQIDFDVRLTDPLDEISIQVWVREDGSHGAGVLLVDLETLARGASPDSDLILQFGPDDNGLPLAISAQEKLVVLVTVVNHDTEVRFVGGRLQYYRP